MSQPPTRIETTDRSTHFLDVDLDEAVARLRKALQKNWRRIDFAGRSFVVSTIIAVGRDGQRVPVSEIVGEEAP